MSYEIDEEVKIDVDDEEVEGIVELESELEDLPLDDDLISDDEDDDEEPLDDEFVADVYGSKE